MVNRPERGRKLVHEPGGVNRGADGAVCRAWRRIRPLRPGLWPRALPWGIGPAPAGSARGWARGRRRRCNGFHGGELGQQDLAGAGSPPMRPRGTPDQAVDRIAMRADRLPARRRPASPGCRRPSRSRRDPAGLRRPCPATAARRCAVAPCSPSSRAAMAGRCRGSSRRRPAPPPPAAPDAAAPRPRAARSAPRRRRCDGSPHDPGSAAPASHALRAIERRVAADRLQIGAAERGMRVGPRPARSAASPRASCRGAAARGTGSAAPARTRRDRRSASPPRAPRASVAIGIAAFVRQKMRRACSVSRAARRCCASLAPWRRRAPAASGCLGGDLPNFTCRRCAVSAAQAACGATALAFSAWVSAAASSPRFNAAVVRPRRPSSAVSGAWVRAVEIALGARARRLPAAPLAPPAAGSAATRPADHARSWQALRLGGIARGDGDQAVGQGAIALGLAAHCAREQRSCCGDRTMSPAAATAIAAPGTRTTTRNERRADSMSMR